MKNSFLLITIFLIQFFGIGNLNSQNSFIFKDGLMLYELEADGKSKPLGRGISTSKQDFINGKNYFHRSQLPVDIPTSENMYFYSGIEIAQSNSIVYTERTALSDQFNLCSFSTDKKRKVLLSTSDFPEGNIIYPIDYLDAERILLEVMDFSTMTERKGIYIFNIKHGDLNKIPISENYISTPSLSPDKSTILYSAATVDEKAEIDYVHGHANKMFSYDFLTNDESLVAQGQYLIPLGWRNSLLKSEGETSVSEYIQQVPFNLPWQSGTSYCVSRAGTPAPPAPIGSSSACNIYYPSTGFPAHTYVALDFDTPNNVYDPITAAAAGTITFAGWNTSGYGNLVIITHSDNSVTYYAHLKEILVSEDDYVQQGCIVGDGGTTGNSSGDHLHFEWRVGNQRMYPIFDECNCTPHQDYSYTSNNSCSSESIPDAPTLQTPTSSNTSIPVFFNWTNTTNGEYRIQVSTSNNGWTQQNGFTSNNNCNSTVIVNKNTGFSSQLTWDDTGSGICVTPQNNTTYYWTARVYVDGSGTSYYAQPKSFTTTGGSECNAPTGLYANNITNTTATIGNSSVSGATYYDWIYKTASASSWTAVAGSSSPSQSLNGLQPNTTYQFRAAAYCSGNGWTEWSATKSFTTTGSGGSECNAPTGLYANSITNTTATIGNSSVSGATYYDWIYKTASASSWTAVAGSSNPYQSLNGLQPNTTYQFRAAAYCSGNGWTEWSATKSFTTTGSGGSECNAPTGLYANSITNTTATIGNSSVSGATYYDWIYKTASASSWTAVAGSSSPSQSLNGLQPNTTYQFRAAAYCSGNGWTEWSATKSFTTTGSGGSECNAPTGLYANNITNTTATIGNSSVSGATYYDWIYKTASASSWTAVAGSSSPSQSLNGLQPNTTYQFRAAAYCSGNGWTEWSATKSFTTTGSGGSECNAPTGLYANNITNTTATIGNSSVSGATYYDWIYKTASASSWTAVAGSSSPSQSLNGLQPNTTYQFRAAAYCSGNGWTEWSATKSFTTTGSGGSECNAPTGLYANNITNTTATIGNSSVSGATYYDWIYKTASASSWTAVAGSSSPSQSLNGLQPNTTYQFRAAAYCSGNGWTEWSATKSFTTTGSGGSECNAPTGLYANNITNTTATIGNSSVSGATYYDWIYKTASASSWTAVAGSSSPSQSLNGLQPNTTYQFRAAAYCSGNGWTEWSATKSFTTTGSGGSECNAPTGLYANNITNTTATIGNSSVSGATYYDWIYKTASASSWTAVAGSSSPSQSLNGLQPNTTYQFRAAAYCSGNGWTEWSATKTFTTTGGGSGNTNYCASAGSNSSYEWIQSISISPGFSNDSGNNNGSANYNATSYPLSAGSHSVTLTPGFSGTTYSEYWRIWIDFDKDGTYESNELVFSQNSSGAINGSFSR